MFYILLKFLKLTVDLGVVMVLFLSAGYCLYVLPSLAKYFELTDDWFRFKLQLEMTN